ncbi:serine/threonine-protein kinase [Sorangium cellulosum]|uniref:serine/threonine-protein kinase n=1 Tax=Sorangium cellulosum TaxID=56 RepID=UPI001F476AB0|nr:serine/threonine-protein kinase [Sorangium cellulosum]
MSRASAAFPRAGVLDSSAPDSSARASAPDASIPEALDMSLLSPLIPPASPSSPSGSTRRIYREGDVIGGKYRLRYVLGEGGMGMVWLARNDVLHVDVAVKFIRREVTSSEATHRLLQEARAAARIDHPSIVRVLDYGFGESEQVDPFIVMEVLRGEQLVEAIERRKRFSPAAAVRILLPIASALVAAHDRKIVHRDLKPENIFLVKNDRGDITPKIVDFGIAKVWSETSGGDVTKAGTVLGSPDYMSPEQARGITDVDGQTDIWAFSVVLYETITGQRPFQGGNYPDLVAAILVKDPVPTTALGVGDATLWGIIERGLAKERAGRWRTMRDMGVALARWALANGVEDDVTGTSIAVHWLSDGVQRPLSERPTMRPTKQSSAALETAPQPPAAPPRDGRRLVTVFVALSAVVVIGALGVALASLRSGEAPAGAAPSAAPQPAAPQHLAPAAAAAPPADPQAAGGERGPEPGRAAGTQAAAPAPSAGAARRDAARGGAASAGSREPAAPPSTASARRTAPARSKTSGAALPVPARPNF